jgi:hypothetical protein
MQWQKITKETVFQDEGYYLISTPAEPIKFVHYLVERNKGEFTDYINPVFTVEDLPPGTQFVHVVDADFEGKK